MFKITIFLFSLILSTSLISQSLQSINPNSGAPGQSLTLTLSGNNTHFNQGSNTIWFSQGSNTGFYMNNPTATSASNVTGNVYIPYGTQNGLYDVNAYNNSDGIMTMYNAFSVAATNAQLISVTPNNGNHGQMLNLSLSCQNASFSSGTNTQVWFSQGSFTMMGTNTTIVNNNLINTDLYISPTAPSGAYSSMAYNSIDGTLMKASSFNVNSATPINGTVYPNISKPGKTIDVLIQFNNTVNYSQLYFKRNNIIIPINIQNVMGYGIYCKAIIPSSATIGTYDLYAANSNITVVLTNALTIVYPSQPSIDSATVDSQNYETLDIYGDQTHFTATDLTLEIDSSFQQLQLDSFEVISNNHLIVHGHFVIYGVKAPTPIQSWIKITNSADGVISYPFVTYMYGSITENTFNNIRYFPNPTNDIIRIQSDEFYGKTILAEVYSPSGKLVLQKEFKNGESINIDLKPFASGLYNIRVSSKEKTKTLSVIRR